MFRRLLSAALLCLLPAAQAAGWLTPQLPPRTQQEWVLQQAVVNGVPTQVMRLESELGPDELIAFFKRQWRQGLPTEGKARGWRTLVLRQDPLQLVLQVQPAGQGSQALLSQMNLRERRSDFLPAELPALAQAQLLQVTESRDGAKRSRLVQFSSRAGYDLVQRQLRQHWQRQGWRTLFDQNGPQRGSRQWLAAFEKPGLSVDVVLAEHEGSLQISFNLLDEATP